MRGLEGSAFRHTLENSVGPKEFLAKNAKAAKGKHSGSRMVNIFHALRWSEGPYIYTSALKDRYAVGPTVHIEPTGVEA
jgi:hypothetical protein